MAINFQWHKFSEIFPFGDLTRSQGQYSEAVEECLEQIEKGEHQKILLDLLDMQWMARLEQIWIANELSNDDDFSADTVAARLQINSNIRFHLSLGPNNSRTAMHKLKPKETLASIICA